MLFISQNSMEIYTEISKHMNRLTYKYKDRYTNIWTTKLYCKYIYVLKETENIAWNSTSKREFL